jgi:cytochrome c peroxidase
MKTACYVAMLVGLTAAGCTDVDRRAVDPAAPAVLSDDVDAALRTYLVQQGFTGRVANTLETRLGRKIDRQLADLGRLLWFDPIQGLNDDNTCGGCHSPTAGFGDTQPIAIGIDNNRMVRAGAYGPA